jgi:2-polyprenyl-3-methyl-5-hydroxy-6-metoxy-1,4-benzoquinol methylase
LERQYDEVHKTGIVGLDVGFGNVIEDARTRQPVLCDFEVCRYFKDRSSFAFAYARNRDRLEMNVVYERGIMTEQSAHAALAQQRTNGTGWYAPLNFGHGLGVPGFWLIDAGTGRWEHLNGCVLNALVQNKRILDLGSNNGAMPMMMLRAGAKEVLCIEYQEKFVKQGEFVRKLFEWRDIARYDLRYHQGSMLDILKADLGHFDIVTAFCSLYHLSEEEMAEVVRRASQLSPVMILQGNLHKAAKNKSRTQFLKQVLEENGFASVEVHAPRNFARPLLIGRQVS